jgi:hypothetical protein
MMKRHHAMCLLGIIFFVLSPLLANAQVPFGGIVSVEYVCNTGLLVYVLTAPSGAPAPFMWFWGELPFLFHIPPHPGQILLGMAAATPVPCILGYIPIGYGLPIIFHGSSL